MRAQRTRVLFLTAWYPTSANPVAGVFVREHARAAALHADVHVLHVDEDTSMRGWHRLTPDQRTDLTAGLPTYRLTYRRLFPRGKQVTATLATLRALRILAAKGFHPDIVHGHVFLSAVPAFAAARRSGCPLVFTEHSSEFPRRVVAPKHVRRTRFVYKRAARVLPVSRSLERSLREHGIKARYDVVPNAYDPADFHPRPGGSGQPGDGPPRLLFVGGLQEAKGIDVLLEASAQLRAAGDDFTLDLVGDGKDRHMLERLVDELGLGERVTFHGALDKHGVGEMMRSADLLVLPSRWENLPCVIIEAMGSGLPVVASDVGGIAEMVDAQAGRLVEPEAPGALADALQQMLDARDTYDPLTIAERARNRYSLQAVGARLDDVYRHALDDSGAGRA